jgi:hypothetical protein
VSSTVRNGAAAVDDMSSAPVGPDVAIEYRIHQRAGGSRPSTGGRSAGGLPLRTT